MVELVAQSNNQLAIAARAAAYTVPLIDLDPSMPSQRELILVRYAKPPVSGNFVFKVISQGGPIAMWADCVSEDAPEMYLIAGYGISHLITALQVVRLGTPANFNIGDLAKRNNKQVLWTKVGPLKKTNGGNEFWLNFDIVAAQVAEIPLTVMNNKFVVDPSKNYTTPPQKYPPLKSADYKVTKGAHGMIDCVLA
ncbi:hypothetical protein ACXX82_17235 [Glaciimonas sp. GNP009]